MEIRLHVVLVDITDALHEGQNEVLVRCHLRHPNSRWYSGAGLFRQVELWKVPDFHLMPDGCMWRQRSRQRRVEHLRHR